MKTKINDILKLFINISGEKHSIADLLDELKRIEKRIPDINNKLEKLKSGMTDDKYFDASSEIIDRNIEISLQKKLDYLYKKLSKLKEKYEDLLAKHKQEEERYSSLNKTLDACQSFVHDLNNFNFNISSDSIQKLIDMENERFDFVYSEINNIQNNRNNVNNENKSISEEIANLERLIQTEEDRLLEIRESLKSKKTYINEESKTEDLKQISDFESERQDLVARKAQIIDSITYQVNIINKELDNSNPDKAKILDITQMIAAKLNDMPYLAVEDDSSLAEEYSQLSSQRDELTAVIENKRYNLKNKKPYELRIEFINQKLANAQDIKEDYESLLNFILNQEIEVTIDNLVKLKNEEKEMMNAFAENAKSIIQKEYMAELISNYEKDLAKTLEKAKDIKNKIEEQDKEMAEARQEIESIKSENKLDFDLENQIEREVDNKMLETIINKLKYLNTRIRVGVTPNQLYDQIEMLLDTDSGETKSEPVRIEEPIIKNMAKEEPGYTFEKVDEPTEETFNKNDMIVSPDKYINDFKDEGNEKEFSFSPIDDTGFVSFSDAYDIAN